MSLSLDRFSRGLRTIVLVVLALPCGVIVLLTVILPLCVLGLLSGICLVISEFRLSLKMRRRGRYLSRSERSRRFAGGRGTVIIESPTVGWRVTRAWWTEDDVLALAPCDPPGEDQLRNGAFWGNAFLQWAHAEYTNIEDGRAYLLAVWNGARLKRQFAKHYPSMRFVDLWSGAVTFKQSSEKPDSCA